MTDIKGIPYEKRPYCELVGCDSNAFAIMGRVVDALKRAGLHEEARAYRLEALAGDYDHLLAVSLSYVREGRDRSSDGCDDDECCESCGEPFSDVSPYAKDGLCEGCAWGNE